MPDLTTRDELEENGQLARPLTQVVDAVQQGGPPPAVLPVDDDDLQLEADLVIAISLLESVRTDVFLFLKANADIRHAIPMQDWVTLTAIEKAINSFVKECDEKSAVPAPFVDPCSC